MSKIGFAHIFFMDGVGLGPADPAGNPFLSASMPYLTQLFGPAWFLNSTGRIITPRASLIPTDACLGVPGRPQSATGQATILTGRNVPQLIGEHYGPKPTPAIAAIIEQNNLFLDAVISAKPAALLSPYPQGFFDSWRRGKRLLSAVPLAATSAGLSLMTADDLRAGRAISPDFTGRGWHDHLGYDDTPIRSLEESGRDLAHLASHYHFSFFEHWPSDRLGHRGELSEAASHLESLDTVLGHLIENWDHHGLLIITSDHGNIEEKRHRQHTINPVPTILVGPNHAELAQTIHDLSHIAALIRTSLYEG